jgi:putative endopeptidase
MKLASCIECRLFAALTSLCILVSLDVQKDSYVASAKDQDHGLLPANMDRSVRPGDDPYRYANGAWLKRSVVPAERSYVDPFGTDVDDSNNDLTPQTTGLIQAAAKARATAGSNARQIADVYNSYMDEAAIEAKGLAPIRPHLDAIAAIRDKTGLARALGEGLRADVDALNSAIFHTPNLFGLWVTPGFDDSSHYTAYLMQGGLEMPDREYYLSDTIEMRDTRANYQEHVSALLKLAGMTDAELRAKRIVALEHAIAEKHESLADSQDIGKANNTWSQSDFRLKAPGLDWDAFFRAAGLGQQEKFIVWQPTAFAGESALVASEDLESWKDWLEFHFLEDYAFVLPKAIADKRFSFAEGVLWGRTKQRSREQRAAILVHSLLGQAVGQLYAERYFTPQTRSQIQTMVTNIIFAFRRRIDALSWMDPATKAEAKKKLTNLYVGIGYPETWRDYSAFEVRADDAFGNLWRGRLFEYHRSVARLGHSVDRKEWVYNPQSVDAMELPLQNALTFPAAYLQPPLFDPLAPVPVNYGTLGTGIGHEISHIFDNQGSRFDPTGRVRNWWQAADLVRFNAATEKLAAQYDTYKPLADLSVNGKQTLAEDIADLAGLDAAFDAYRATFGGREAPVWNDLSGDQQFFLGFAQSWAIKSTEASLRQQLLTDVHAPAEFRPATVRNHDAWYAAFDVKPGDKLYLAPDDRVRIW